MPTYDELFKALDDLHLVCECETDEAIERWYREDDLASEARKNAIDVLCRHARATRTSSVAASQKEMKAMNKPKESRPTSNSELANTPCSVFVPGDEVSLVKYINETSHGQKLKSKVGRVVAVHRSSSPSGFMVKVKPYRHHFTTLYLDSYWLRHISQNIH
jgi:hypothetical protein